MRDPAPHTFPSQTAFRAWLDAHGSRESALVVRFLKAHVPGRGLTYAQALDEALCFGWIDGVRRRLDESSYTIRFTPRKPRSMWSRVNVAHVERLTRQGRMAAPGLAAFAARHEDRTGLHSFERAALRLAPAYARAFRAKPKARDFFAAQARGYRRTCTYWVMSAKREETRARRLAQLIACSARGRRIPQLGAP